MASFWKNIWWFRKKAVILQAQIVGKVNNFSNTKIRKNAYNSTIS